MEGLGELMKALAPLGGISAGGILAILVVMVFFGKIPTPGMIVLLKERLADKDAVIVGKDVEIDHWRTAWTNINEAQLATSKQLEKLVEKTDAAATTNELVVALLQSLRTQTGVTP